MGHKLMNSARKRGDETMDRKVIAAYLKTLREQKKETQADVAKAIGVSGGSYGMYETGERIPRDDVKVKIANHFGTTVQSIFFENSLTQSY